MGETDASKIWEEIGKRQDFGFKSRGVAQGLARMVWDHEAGGSNPLAPILEVDFVLKGTAQATSDHITGTFGLILS